MLVAVLATGCGKKPKADKHKGHDQAAQGHKGHDHAGHGHAAHEAAKKADAPAPAEVAQTTCPVMGGKIDRKVFADHEGKRVYFCCPACVAQFKKEPAKYLKKLADQGVALEKAPATQPKAKKDAPTCGYSRCTMRPMATHG